MTRYPKPSSLSHGLLLFALLVVLVLALAVANVRPAHAQQSAAPALSFNDTTTPLTGSATFTGTTRDAGFSSGFHAWNYFQAYFRADQTGTASIECSNDNSTWVTCATQPLAASTPIYLQVPVVFTYQRVKLVNGSSAEGALNINSGYGN